MVFRTNKTTVKTDVTEQMPLQVVPGEVIVRPHLIYEWVRHFSATSELWSDPADNARACARIGIIVTIVVSRRKPENWLTRCIEDGQRGKAPNQADCRPIDE